MEPISPGTHLSPVYHNTEFDMFDSLDEVVIESR